MLMPKYPFCVRKKCPKRAKFSMRSPLEMSYVQNSRSGCKHTLSLYKNPDKSPLYKFFLNCSRGFFSGGCCHGVFCLEGFDRGGFCPLPLLSEYTVTTES